MTESIRPSVIVRLIAVLGSQARICDSLRVPDAYPCRWLAAGFIPADWALDVHDLRLKDGWGRITAMDVLEDARDVQRKRFLDAGVS